MGDPKIPIKEVHFVKDNEEIVVVVPCGDLYSQFNVSTGEFLDSDFLDELDLLMRKYNLWKSPY